MKFPAIHRSSPARFEALRFAKRALCCKRITFFRLKIQN
uniref:Uncharacterized protein n=1 Tax=Anguilla anguilla TaxID=7936 RepID=A0A0E9Q7P0_ANGAN